uniref:DUF7788 domain-containing protein n=1 Tax=viral metagenome TaxID=1070528 RepID=A0A6C0HR32_9ZZZZ
MAALVNALDSYTPKQVGEKGHAEYSWSSDLQEKILQLSFQFTRCDPIAIESHADTLWNLLRNLTATKDISREKFVELMTVAYKMVGHTRDIIDGKGEYSLAYMQVLVWNEFYPELARFVLTKFVSSDGHPYGSWKDIKYFCNYCRSKKIPVSDPLLQHAFQLLLGQLRLDASSEKKSLAAKWVPRAKSHRFGWIFNELAVVYFKEYIETAKTNVQIDRAVNKAKMDFRKLLANLNRALDTTQIHQCDGTWSQIDHAKTTSITISKQKTAFLNKKKDGTQRSENEDRIQCAENFTARIKKAAAGEVEMKGKRVGLNSFTVQARDLIFKRPSDDVQIEIDLLNAQWRDNSTQTGALGPMVAMLDFSGSMDGDPRDVAMALGCRVAEKSILGKRVLSFSTNPTWHNLDGCDNFVDMIRVLQKGEVGYSTNFYGAFDRILDAIVEKKLTPDQVEGMILAIFSDMQIDDPNVGAPKNMETFYETMERKYAETGERLWGTPFKPPHILFWNLRSTSGFPCLSSQKNVSMMSGFSPALLNLFCEKGLDALQGCTPWSVLVEQMNKPRYQCLEDKVREVLA